MIVKRDGIGYSVHETRVFEGAELHLHYKHHYEANYCMEGEGEVLDVATGERHAIRPGTLYALNLNDQHVLRATKGDLRLVCVFNPPLSGTETSRRRQLRRSLSRMDNAPLGAPSSGPLSSIVG